MHEGELTIPVTVEQIAAAIHRMSKAERNILLRLVPELASHQPVEQSASTERQYNFAKARELLQEVKGSLSEEVAMDRERDCDAE